jgi:SAM-dependent methyltransferase
MTAREIDAIYRDGAHYDRLFGPGYVDFWLSRAQAAGGPVLELGCGTGKLAVPLAEAGFSVVGLDNSPALLEFAAGKSDAVRWIDGDMRSFDLDESDRVGSLDLKMYFPKELEALVHCNGLRIAARLRRP